MQIERNAHTVWLCGSFLIIHLHLIAITVPRSIINNYHVAPKKSFESVSVCVWTFVCVSAVCVVFLE
jgi:hypothetical protein